VVTGLSSQTTYFFALKVQDELGNTSPINSNGPVSGTTLDIIAPAEVTTLAAILSPPTLSKVTAPAIEASGQYSATKGPERATDGNLDSYWQSPERTTMQPEFITLDTGATHNVGRVRLRSPGVGLLFPEDLQIQVSDDNVSFSTLDSRAGLPNTQGIWHEFDFSPGTGRYVRIYITKTRISGTGKYTARIAEIEVFEASPSDQITLSWNAPGDDANSGTAAIYDIRYSTSAIDSDAKFDGATPLAGEPAPSAAGDSQTMSFSAPETGVILHFAMKSSDEAGNMSPLSNDAQVDVPAIP
jgi:hypothetical protein